MGRDEKHTLRKVFRTDIPGKRKRGRMETCNTPILLCWIESERGDGQGDMVYEDHPSYRRPD